MYSDECAHALTETYKTPGWGGCLQTTWRAKARGGGTCLYPSALGRWRHTVGSLAGQPQLLSELQTKEKSCFKIRRWWLWANIPEVDLWPPCAHAHLLTAKGKGTKPTWGYSSKLCHFFTQEKKPLFYSARNQLEQLNVKELGRWHAGCCLILIHI